MADTKAVESENEILSDGERARNHQWQRGRVLDDILHRTISELADARVDKEHYRRLHCEESARANRTYWKFRDLLNGMKRTLAFLERWHHKAKPAHRKTAEAKCGECYHIAQLRLDLKAAEEGR